MSRKYKLLSHGLALGSFERSPVDYIIKDIIDPQTCNLVYAPAGGMKSLYCLALAASVAQGKEFLGKPSIKTNVLYLDGEMSCDSIAKRVELMNISNIPIENFTYIATASIVDYEANLADEKQREDYLKEIVASGYKLVVLDNIRTLCQISNENDSSEFGSFNAWIKRLRGRGITVIVVHHSNKTKEDGSRALYAGSSNIATVFESIICLEKHEDNTLTLHVDKDRNNTIKEYLDGANIRLNSTGEFELITDDMVSDDYYQTNLARAGAVIAQVMKHPTECKAVLKNIRTQGFIVDGGTDSWEKLYNNMLLDYSEFDTLKKFGEFRNDLAKKKRENANVY